jgi:hypothetical protein
VPWGRAAAGVLSNSRFVLAALALHSSSAMIDSARVLLVDDEEGAPVSLHAVPEAH